MDGVYNKESGDRGIEGDEKEAWQGSEFATRIDVVISD